MPTKSQVGGLKRPLPDMPRQHNAAPKWAIYAAGIGFLPANIAPVLMGAWAHMDDAGADANGVIAALMMGSGAIAIFLGVKFSRRLLGRNAVRAAAIGCAVSWMSMGSGHASLAATAIALGLTSGLITAAAYRSLGKSADPTRAFLLSIVSQMALATGFSLFYAEIAESSARLFWIVLALLAGTVTGGARHFSGHEHGVQVNAPTPITQTCGYVVYVVGATTFWFLIESVSVHAGYSTELLGKAIALASMASVASSLGASAITRLIRPTWLAAAGVILGISGYPLLLLHDPRAFVFGVMVFSAGWAIGLPAFLALLNLADPAGRAHLLALAFTTASGAAGALLGGIAARAVPPAWILSTSAAMMIVSLALVATISPFNSRKDVTDACD